MTGVLAGLRAGDPIVVSDSQRRITHRKVAHVGRIWLTDDSGWKYRIEDGRSEDRLQYGYGTKAMTAAMWHDREEERQLSEVLRRWGMHPDIGAAVRKSVLTREQLRLVAALLEHFEGGDYQELLTRRGSDFGLDVADAARQFAVSLRGARRRIVMERT